MEKSNHTHVYEKDSSKQNITYISKEINNTSSIPIRIPVGAKEKKNSNEHVPMYVTE